MEACCPLLFRGHRDLRCQGRVHTLERAVSDVLHQPHNAHVSQAQYGLSGLTQEVLG